MLRKIGSVILFIVFLFLSAFAFAFAILRGRATSSGILRSTSSASTLTLILILILRISGLFQDSRVVPSFSEFSTVPDNQLSFIIHTNGREERCPTIYSRNSSTALSPPLHLDRQSTVPFGYLGTWQEPVGRLGGHALIVGGLGRVVVWVGGRGHGHGYGYVSGHVCGYEYGHGCYCVSLRVCYGCGLCVGCGDGDGDGAVGLASENGSANVSACVGLGYSLDGGNRESRSYLRRPLE